jgi:hypothetical protein
MGLMIAVRPKPAQKIDHRRAGFGRPATLWLLVMFGVVACNGHDGVPGYVRGGPAEIDETGLHPVRLKGSLVATDNFLGRPSQLAVSDSTLWIGDEAGDPFIHLIDRSDGHLMRSFGRHGEGPGDFQGLFGLVRRPADTDAIWASDVSLRRLTRFGTNPLVLSRVIRFPLAGPQVQWLNRNQLVLVSSSDSMRLTIFDTAGAVVRYATGPLLGNDSIPLDIRVRVSNDLNACSQPGGIHFAIVFTDAGRGEIYDSALHRAASLSVPYPSDGDFVRDGTTHIWSLHVPRIYYIACAATPRYLYAAFAGRQQKVGATSFAANARYVHVYSWTGHLVRVLELDHDALAIAMDGDTTLYAIGLKSDSIFKYRVPETGQ